MLFLFLRNIFLQTNTMQRCRVKGRKITYFPLASNPYLSNKFSNILKEINCLILCCSIIPQKEKAIMKDFYFLLSCKHRKTRNGQSAKRLCTERRELSQEDEGPTSHIFSIFRKKIVKKHYKTQNYFLKDSLRLIKIVSCHWLIKS